MSNSPFLCVHSRELIWNQDGRSGGLGICPSTLFLVCGGIHLDELAYHLVFVLCEPWLGTPCSQPPSICRSTNSMCHVWVTPQCTENTIAWVILGPQKPLRGCLGPVHLDSLHRYVFCFNQAYCKKMSYWLRDIWSLPISWR